MRALSLSQPWAHVVVHGPKRIENRPIQLLGAARKHVGDRIAIHAAKSWDASGAAFAAGRGLIVEERGAYVAGAVIGVATVDRVFALAPNDDRVPADQVAWAFGPACILLSDVRAIARPVPCRGFLGFWTLPPVVEGDLRAQLDEVA